MYKISQKGGEINQMGYIISTKDHTYHLEDTDDPMIKIISGGKYRQNEIRLLSESINGQQLSAVFTDNPSNHGLSGELLISDMISIQKTPHVQVARPHVQTSKPAEHAGQFFVMDNRGRDIANILRRNRENIEYGVEEQLGLPETVRQKVFVSPTIFSQCSSQCTVIFAHFENQNDEVISKTIKSEVLSILGDDCGCSETMFVEKSHLYSIEQNYSDKALGLNVSSRLKSFSPSKPTITSTTPLLVNQQVASLSPSL
jgi:hypothetical protein